MNERATRAPSMRSDGRGRIADARRRVSTAHLDVAHQQYGAAPASYQNQASSALAQQSYAQYAPNNNNNGGYANDLQGGGGGPLYSIRSPAMASTARRPSRAPVDPPPGDGRYYYADALPRGVRDVRTAAGVVAGVSTNTRTSCAGASVRREHTVYAAPPREAGIVSHMPSVAYGGGNGSGNGGGNGAYASAAPYDNGQGFYGNGDQQQQQYAPQAAYGAARPYASEPPPPPPPGGGAGAWPVAPSNCGNSNYGTAPPQANTANNGSYGNYATAAPSQPPVYGQQPQPQPQSVAYAQPPPVQQPQQQQQPTYGQAPSAQPSYGAPAPNGQQQQQQQPAGNVVGAAGPTYASAPACPPSSQANAPGQLGVAPQQAGAYGVAPQQLQQQQQQMTYGAAAVSQQQQPVYAQQQATYGAVAEPVGAVAAAQPLGAVAQVAASQAVGVASPVAAAAPVVGAVAAAAPTVGVAAAAPVVGVAAAAVPQAVEVAAVGPPLSVGAPAVVQQPAVFAAAPPPQPVFAAPPPPVFAAAPPPVFAAAQPVLAAAPVCQRQLTLIRHTDRGSGNALDDEALGLGPPAGSSPFEGTIGPGPAFGDFYVLSRPNANTTLTAGQAVQLTAGPTNNTALHRGNATEIVIETCSGNPGTFEICISAVTTNPSQFGIRVAGQSTTPHVRTFGSDTNAVSGCLIIKCVRTPLIIQLVLVSTDGPGGTTTLPSSPGGTGECRIISLVIKQIC